MSFYDQFKLNGPRDLKGRHPFAFDSIDNQLNFLFQKSERETFTTKTTFEVRMLASGIKIHIFYDKPSSPSSAIQFNSLCLDLVQNHIEASDTVVLLNTSESDVTRSYEEYHCANALADIAFAASIPIHFVSKESRGLSFFQYFCSRARRAGVDRKNALGWFVNEYAADLWSCGKGKVEVLTDATLDIYERFHKRIRYNYISSAAVAFYEQLECKPGLSQQIHKVYAETAELVLAKELKKIHHNSPLTRQIIYLANHLTKLTSD